MTPLTTLWLPVLLSALFAFIASFLIHMFLGWHKGDFATMPGEEGFRDAVRPLHLPPGDYMTPRPTSREDMRSAAFDQKMADGPVVMMTVMPNGPMSMGRSLILWFVYCAVVSFFAAYIASRALAPGAIYLEVFRFVGTTAFIGYSLALWQMSIWYRRRWLTTILATLDGLIFAMLSAGVFGWLWPR